MNRFEGKETRQLSGSFEEGSKDLKSLVEERTSIQQFDASQYAFFGDAVLQEELGGFDDDNQIEELGGFDDEDYDLSVVSPRKEVEYLDVISESDVAADLSSSFKRIDHMSGERRFPPTSGDLGLYSTEYTSDSDFLRETKVSNWPDQQLVDPDIEHVASKIWPPYETSLQRASEESSKLLYRHSYPPQQWSGEQNFMQFPFSSYPPSRSPVPQNPPTQRSPPSQASQIMLSGSPQVSHCSASHHHFGVSPPLMQYRGSLPQYNLGHAMSGRPQLGTWINHANMAPAGPTNIMGNLMHQQVPRPLLRSQAQALLHQQRFQAFQSGIPRFPSVTQVLNSYPSPVTSKYGDSGLGVDPRDQRRPQRNKQNQRHYQHNPSDFSRINNGWLQFRSKYMSSDEIESIVRMQLAATHSNDPYVDDYYHQAMQARKSRGKYHFAPSSLRELSSRTRAAAEPHAYLQVDALGRLPFSSVRRPRPLLEVDAEVMNEPTSAERPLEQEPMLAARIVIEDGLSLLLDVDDIDRYLVASQQPDGGVQLKRRRQALLEGLATSLHLDDSHTDDRVFIRLVSLPKGRKLLSKYLQLLPPASHLACIASMAVFRHLRFLFGGLSSDPVAAATTTVLARSVATNVASMDLDALIDFLTAVVQSFEQQAPPLRPLGSSAGDGASVVLKAVLERAANLLNDPCAMYSEMTRNRWQIHFNFFFSLLTRYVNSKYDSIMQSLVSSTENSAAIQAAASYAMKRELPVELLQTCLPIINDDQREDLIEFTKRPISAAGYVSPNCSDKHSNTAPIPG
eukprot:TRINITY_DN11265_c0_g2_i1.p1 TRINITY_DN11265_c0_g2~~TRINITY_DN11265_c0_g2_i1.p1  ORF type:complete len:794 (-),score=154.67 TRINITY_DN11265_c0_g2_i1:257-2638(-)